MSYTIFSTTPVYWSSGEYGRKYIGRSYMDTRCLHTPTKEVSWKKCPVFILFVPVKYLVAEAEVYVFKLLILCERADCGVKVAEQRVKFLIAVKQNTP